MFFRYRYSVGNNSGDLVGDAVGLVAYDNYVGVGELEIADILPFSECSHNPSVPVACGEECRKVESVHIYVGERAHCGLYCLGVVQFHAVLGAYYCFDSEPVGGADNGAEVSGVGDVVEGEDGPAVSNGRQC